jgi:hypothetical protein
MINKKQRLIKKNLYLKELQQVASKKYICIHKSPIPRLGHSIAATNQTVKRALVTAAIKLAMLH